MVKNKDYRDGMKFLLRETREQKMNIRMYPWVADLSVILSKSNKCLKFWTAVWEQHNLPRIPKCHTLFDLFFGFSTNLFTWSQTIDGHEYWKKTFTSLFYGDLTDSYEATCRCKEIPLSALHNFFTY